MITTAAMLDNLDDLRAKADLTRANRDDLKAKIMGDELIKTLKEVDDEFQSELDRIQSQAATIESQIKDEVLLARESIEGQHLRAKFNPGGAMVTAKDVRELADKYSVSLPIVAAQMRGLITQKKASVIIEAIKK